MRCSKLEPVEKVTSSVPLKTYNSMVYLYASRSRLKKITRTKAKISKYHILENGSTGKEIYHKIINTDVGLSERYRNINYCNVIPALSPILESLIKRHKRYNYLDKLKYIIAEDGKKYVKQKYNKQIHMHSLRSFFNLLLYENIPLELFGTRKNFNAIKKTIYRLFNTVPQRIKTRTFKRIVHKKYATGAILNIQPLFERLDISKIEWLHSIKINKIQWIIILKLLHWFFAQYIIKILHKYIVLIAVKKRWVYIVKDDWCKMQEEFMQGKESRGDLVTFPAVDESKWKLSIGRYKYIPSISGLRVILIVKYNIKEKFDANVALRFLQQLYITYFNKKGISNVNTCFQEIFEFKKSSSNRLYYVRCDIQDAYGSIIQEKLNDIITACCKQLPMYLAVRTYRLHKTRKSYKKLSKGVKEEVLQVLNLKKHIKDATIINKKPKLVKMTKLIYKIRKFIFGHRVKANGKIYSIKFGVPQGVSVSAIFSDIYYAHMFKEIFSVYRNNGFLCTYADDILYITENERYAAGFLETVRNGIPEYNVKFNPRKIQSNVGLPYKPTRIKFLGKYIKL